MNLTSLNTAASTVLAEQPIAVVTANLEESERADLPRMFKQLNRNLGIRFLPIRDGSPFLNDLSPNALTILCVQPASLTDDLRPVLAEMVSDEFVGNCEDYGVSTEEFKKLTGG